ncbi:flagellar assembly protein FliW [Pseudothermotoga thermarum]|uniref:Flagellar assembly factor FliW n=1 Tax=Pseudothermotoga thermarum DSM 5069 TaxID=688269 RepID=F7YYV3_9THEM|nr:flagellar assembly protein FliW [Pseudothermotoga thermarum]AEH51146.1 protein of unknown function DUF180 [Pseudothermotoga thermarum DSM 5069]
MTYTTKLGAIDVEDQDIIVFEQGLPGFENLRKFVVVSLESTEPIKWLVSLEESSVAFPIVNPWLVRIDYTLTLSEEDVKQLQVESEQDVEVFAILTIPHDDPKATTINLLAPVVINKKLRKARQIIQEGTNYQIKHLVTDEIERSKNLLKNKTSEGE